MLRRTAAFALTLHAAGIAAGMPATAWASPADEAKALASKGAALFKKSEYLDAAAAFEKAFALDAREFRVLRYAGRAWQEVGHWDRALTLLERYQFLESDPELKASVQPNIDLLRKATPREKAERLDMAVHIYPQGRLEVEAAVALEALEEAEAYKRAIQLYEVARVAAPTAADKAQLDKEIKRVRDLAKALEARKAETKNASTKDSSPVVTAPAQPKTATSPGPTGLQWAAWGGGAALAVGGAALWALGASQSQAAVDAMDQANKLPSTDPARAGKVKTARSDYDSAGTLYYAGIGLAVVGVAGAAAGFILGPDAKVAVAPLPGGASLAVRF